jgi:peptidoglycan/LPS O-acetylase OafA/YrhL
MSISVPICAGAILSIALHYRRSYDIIYRALGNKAAAPIAMAMLVTSVIWKESNGIVLAWICLPAFIAACVIREDHGLSGILRWRPLAFIGVISYGMYLYNTLAVKFLRPTLAHVGIHHPAIAYPFIVGLTALIAWLSFRYFESPFLGLKQKFSRLHPAPSEAAPVTVNSPELHAAVHP